MLLLQVWELGPQFEGPPQVGGGFGRLPGADSGHAVRGRTFTFAPELWANGKWAIELAEGPPGMTVADGTVRWAVPDGLVERMLRFTVRATGPNGEKLPREYLLPILGPFAD